jgi:diadenosine tetraphosphate (Ap4A) HIT family hydrolase
MSYSQEFEDASEQARVALMRNIAQAADEVREKLNAGTAATALNTLAEAYAYVASPNNAH